jgi:hypothetical protein
MAVSARISPEKSITTEMGFYMTEGKRKSSLAWIFQRRRWRGRMPGPPRRISRGLIVVALAVSAALALPALGAKKNDLGEMMGKMEVAYTEVIKAILVSPVQDEDDISFDQAGLWAEDISKLAGELAKLSDFEKDESARAFLRRLAKNAREIQGLAKLEKWEGMTAALIRLQSTCMACHKENRF